MRELTRFALLMAAAYGRERASPPAHGGRPRGSVKTHATRGKQRRLCSS
jgi:hypothetical protein